MALRVGTALRKGVAFIAAQQRPDGGFVSWSSSRHDLAYQTKQYNTVFTPALILGALAEIPAAATIRQALANWLVQQKSPTGAFNYWAIEAPQRRTLPYPDDLDDTFCALLGLHRHNPELVDSTWLANAVKLLVATEQTVGGPYRTWLVEPSAPAIWRDVDLAVNCNIAAFLRLVAEPLPQLNSLIEAAIVGGQIASPYYPHAYPLYYYMARAYDGALAGRLAGLILDERVDGAWQTPLKTALALSALRRLGATADVRAAADALLAWQQTDGSWPAEAFCLDPTTGGRRHYSGAPALTTALALEALALWQPAVPAPAHRPRAADQQRHRRIAQATKRQLRVLGPELRRQTAYLLKNLQQSDVGPEVTLLPHWFAHALHPSIAQPRESLLNILGRANLLGWAAYTAFDDFLDDEGRPVLLPAATYALRASLQTFRQALPEQPAFQELVSQTFDVIDNANSWEVTHCRLPVRDGIVTIGRLPRYHSVGQLADRSLGHALTPVGVLTQAGFALDSPAIQHTTSAIRHYLAARQLNDDLHDWQDDLRAGRCSYVVTALLREIKLQPGPYQLDPLIAQLQSHFWQHALPRFCRLVERETARGHRAIRASQVLQPDTVLSSLLDGIAAVAQRTAKEQTKAITFLDAYSS